jgi:glycosyltransferase involved in cell wall biosynthesis
MFCFGRSKSAAPILRKETAKVLTHLNHFLTGAGSERAGFPLRFLDYELGREGATWARIEVSETPLVSIITRTHAGKYRERFLKHAGASVVNQTYKALEWVVVEDGGETRRDVVEDLVSKGRNPPKFLFLTSARGGRSAAGNLGLERSSGNFCMFLDDDDLLYADHLETLYSAIYSGGFKASYSLACEVQTRVEEHGYKELPIGTASLHKQPWDYEVLKDHNFIPIQSLLFDRRLFLERGGFDISLDQLEDWNLWLRYGFGNKFGYVPKTTSIFRTPADAKERALRQESLHEAYFRARDAAFDSLRSAGIMN